MLAIFVLADFPLSEIMAFVSDLFESSEFSEQLFSDELTGFNIIEWIIAIIPNKRPYVYQVQNSLPFFFATFAGRYANATANMQP